MTSEGKDGKMPVLRRSVLVVACAAVVAACGSGSGGAALDSAYRASVLFADCMRAHGLSSFPDPLPSGGFPSGAGAGNGSPAFNTGKKVCTRFLHAGPAAPAPSAAQEAAMLRFARCVRARGVPDFPDPVKVSQLPRGGNALIDGSLAFAVGPNFDPSAPAFERAGTACGGMPSAGPAPSGPPKGG